MPKRKRDVEPSGPAGPSSRRKSTRVVSLKATSKPGGDGSHGRSNDRSRETNLSSAALSEEVLKMVENKEKAELMILELMRKYTFSLPDLRKLLTQNELNVSFSKVQYVDIAPRIGLEPEVYGNDIPTFEMFHARLPSAAFPIIIRDLQRYEAQYGPMSMHLNEEARSRYISAYFLETVSLFRGRLFNTPETILERRITTKGRIEYHYRTYGGITVVFIEVKSELGTSTERLNCIAQVIAECDACAWLNHQNEYDVPIMAVLCDGKSFLFFKFVDKRPAKAYPQIFLGKFPSGKKELAMPTGGDMNRAAFYQQIRRTCDTFYYVFLIGYQTGLEAYWKRSVEKSKEEGKERDSTPGWYRATVLAKRAVGEAVSAWNLFDEGNFTESVQRGERAVQYLAESVEASPFEPESEFSDFSNFSEMVDKM